MGNIWYESHLHFEFIDFLPIIVLGGTILLSILMINNLKKKGFTSSPEIKTVKIFFTGIITFLCILILVSIISQIDLYKKTVVAYRNGDYQIVEGYVENFEPMSSDGYPPEKFEINGIKFEYSTKRLIPGGYYRAKGDCIIANGQHLKVGYINLGGNLGNIIVYVEKLP